MKAAKYREMLPEELEDQVDQLRTEFTEFLRGYRLDRAVGADRHEQRRFHLAVQAMQAATARRPVLTEKFEAKGAHAGIRVTNMASP